VFVLIAAKAVLVAATVVCLLSIGGAMLFAFPVLLPLHWWASRDSGPYATGGWAFLAAMSVFEAGWMWTYVLTDNGTIGLVVGIVAASATATAFVRRGARRAVTVRA
jgi:hypothetical protein